MCALLCFSIISSFRILVRCAKAFANSFAVIMGLGLWEKKSVKSSVSSFALVSRLKSLGFLAKAFSCESSQISDFAQSLHCPCHFYAQGRIASSL